MEIKECALCKSKVFKYVYPKVDNVVRCAHCGFVFVNKIPSEDNVDIYGKDYFTEGSTDKHFGRDFLSNWGQIYDRNRFQVIIRYLKKFKKSGKLLDIGCALGQFLEFTHQYGYEVTGQDISEDAIRYIKEHFGFPTVLGPLTALIDKEQFDIITMNHVIEHISNPLSYLQAQVFPILRKGGIIFIDTPNFASISSIVNKKEWTDLKPGEHLCYFTPKTLRLCLEKAGFFVNFIHTYSPHRGDLWSFWHILNLLGIPTKVRQRFVSNTKSQSSTNVKKDASRLKGKLRLRSYVRIALNRITEYSVLPLRLLLAYYGREQYLIAIASK